MNGTELYAARQLLDGRVSLTESARHDDGGFDLTAYWLDGGQTVFYSLVAVRKHVEDHEHELPDEIA